MVGSRGQGSREPDDPIPLARDAFTDGQVIDTVTPRRATAAARGESDTALRAESIWDPGAAFRVVASGMGPLAQAGRTRPQNTDVRAAGQRPSSPARRFPEHHGSSRPLAVTAS